MTSPARTLDFPSLDRDDPVPFVPPVPSVPVSCIRAHVTLEVADLARAIRFYADTFGLRLRLLVGAEWAELELPGLSVGLRQRGIGPISTAPGAAAMAIVFEVESLERTGAALDAQGAVWRRPPSGGGGFSGRRLELEDLDGNLLWLVEPRLT